jgi:hypothetical protein
MKSIRIGDTVTKAPPIIHRQIAEIQAIGGNEESVASVIQRAVSALYDQEVIRAHEKQAAYWESEYHALYEKFKAHVNE